MCICSPSLHFPPGLVPYVCRWAGGNEEKGKDRGGGGGGGADGEKRVGWGRGEKEKGVCS